MATATKEEGSGAPGPRQVVVEGDAGGFAQTVSVGGHRLVSDEPVSAGGTDTGLGPYDLLLAKQSEVATEQGVVAQPDERRASGDDEVRAAQQPPVAQTDLPPAGREPAERHAPDRPLQQHRGGVEGDHVTGS